ncbi:meiotically up-regulated gene 184 protein [Mercurialis annua]|uniref:meiotically up-regulated gene 184 protein n=1 Tax=Mercurialis annua TaxID=3986 RepID=UPI00216025AB|nr:meiotically up-regulated gene 184 protein [Mercurialis annua]
MVKESDATKSQLVLEICSISTPFISCSHKHSVKSHFIDWYRILGVKEDADIDVIRKRYRKLALQLHPDKNKHPKAEIAFKLVLEAYSCLSDNVKRREFNFEVLKNFCSECNDKRCSESYTRKLKELNPVTRTRSSRIMQGLKDLGQRFKEEAKVMENCLKTNAARRNESPIFSPSDNLYRSNIRCRLPRESPVFNPSDYLFGGYPHVRNRVYNKPDDIWYPRRENPPNYGKGTSRYDCPIFENRSDRGLFNPKSACVSS